MDNNHKIPALLPQKLVKALAEYLAFKPDGTAEFGKDVEIDGALKTNEFLVMELLDYQFGEGDYVQSPLGIYHFADANGIKDYNVIGNLILNRGDEDAKIYINGFVIFEGSWLFSGNEEAYVLEDRSDIDYSKADYVDFKKKFRHTVVLKMSGGTKKPLGCVSFTDISDSNTKIDSYQDLHTLFGGKILSVSGTVSTFTNDNYNLVYPLTIDLTGGTMAKDSVNILYASTNYPIPVTLSDLGASSFTVEDTVTTI